MLASQGVNLIWKMFASQHYLELGLTAQPAI